MNAHFELTHRARRRFLTQSLAGAGAFALSHLLNEDGVARADDPRVDPQRATSPHARPRARCCIYIYLEGGPSQMDLFDPKPALNQRDGEPLPESLAAKTQFAFLQKDTARLMGTPRTFRRYGECGMEFSNLLPHIAQCADDITMIRSMQTDQFNHVPAQLLMNCGSALAGHPSVGSWLCYGLGSESKNLPAYVALVTAGRGVPGGSASWSSGFLPSNYSGVLFGNDGDSIPNLQDPAGITREIQRTSIDAVVDFNRAHLERTGDPELASRIRSYELAFRMQTAAPELVDLSGETQATLDLYGVNRHEPPIQSNRGGKGLFQTFSRNCLLARRMIERGVRVVNIIHSSWDHHSNLDPEIQHNSLMVDQPIAALLK
ncbi:MAG TPA: DUF1501 domain-containing protein, partial [Caulifigura sp.]|nr:DUF1501 domain-containing protein [Caulifigura sp.]